MGLCPKPRSILVKMKGGSVTLPIWYRIVAGGAPGVAAGDAACRKPAPL